MREVLRPLLPAAAGAAVCATALVAWIRAEPLDLPRALQVALSVALVAAVAALLLVVLRAEREGNSARSGNPTAQ